eukprot:gene8365-17234_t
MSQQVLLECIKKNDLLEIKRILNNSNIVNTKDSKSGMTTLMVAIKSGTLDAVKMILDKTSDINDSNNYGMTAMMIACCNGKIEELSLLLKAGADFNIRNKTGWTALICATVRNDTDAVGLLLDHGADIDLADNEGCTALMAACSHGLLQTAKLLLGRGANHTLRNLAGKTATDLTEDKDVLLLFRGRPQLEPLQPDLEDIQTFDTERRKFREIISALEITAAENERQSNSYRALLEKEKHRHSQESTQLAEEMMSIIERTVFFQEQLDISEKRRNELEEASEESRRLLEEEQKSRQREVESVSNALKECHEQLQSTHRLQKEQEETSTTAILAARKRYEVLENEKHEALNKVESVSRDMMLLAAEMQALRLRISERDNDLECLLTSHRSLQKEFDTLRHSSGDAEISAQSLRQSLRLAESESRTLRQSLIDQDVETKILQRHLNDAKDDANSLRKDVEGKLCQLQSLLGKDVEVNVLQQKLDDTQKELECKRRSLLEVQADAKKEVDEVKFLLHVKEKTLGLLETELNDVRSTNDQSVEELRELKDINSNLQQANFKLNLLYKEKEEGLSMTTNELISIRIDRDARFAQTKIDIEHLRAQLLSERVLYEEEVSKVKKELEFSEREVNSKNIEISDMLANAECKRLQDKAEVQAAMEEQFKALEKQIEEERSCRQGEVDASRIIMQRVVEKTQMEALQSILEDERLTKEQERLRHIDVLESRDRDIAIVRVELQTEIDKKEVLERELILFQAALLKENMPFLEALEEVIRLNEVIMALHRDIYVLDDLFHQQRATNESVMSMKCNEMNELQLELDRLRVYLIEEDNVKETIFSELMSVRDELVSKTTVISELVIALEENKNTSLAAADRSKRDAIALEKEYTLSLEQLQFCLKEEKYLRSEQMEAYSVKIRTLQSDYEVMKRLLQEAEASRQDMSVDLETSNSSLMEMVVAMEEIRALSCTELVRHKAEKESTERELARSQALAEEERAKRVSAGDEAQAAMNRVKTDLDLLRGHIVDENKRRLEDVAEANRTISALNEQIELLRKQAQDERFRMQLENEEVCRSRALAHQENNKLQQSLSEERMLRTCMLEEASRSLETVVNDLHLERVERAKEKALAEDLKMQFEEEKDSLRRQLNNESSSLKKECESALESLGKSTRMHFLAEKTRLIEEVESIRNKLKVVEDDKITLLAKVEELKTSLESATARCDVMRVDLETFGLKLDIANIELTTLQNDKKSLSAKVEGLKSSLGDATFTINSTRGALTKEKIDREEERRGNEVWRIEMEMEVQYLRSALFEQRGLKGNGTGAGAGAGAGTSMTSSNNGKKGLNSNYSGCNSNGSDKIQTLYEMLAEITEKLTATETMAAADLESLRYEMNKEKLTLKANIKELSFRLFQANKDNQFQCEMVSLQEEDMSAYTHALEQKEKEVNDIKKKMQTLVHSLSGYQYKFNKLQDSKKILTARVGWLVALCLSLFGGCLLLIFYPEQHEMTFMTSMSDSVFESVTSISSKVSDMFTTAITAVTTATMAPNVSNDTMGGENGNSCASRVVTTYIEDLMDDLSAFNS